MLGKTLDIVVPCYNEQECVELFYDSACKVLQNTRMKDSWRILFVDDGSKDKTLDRIKALEQRCREGTVKYISFSRNFGKESAIFAGLSYASADYVVLMDADLQHPVSILPEMIARLDAGYDCCGARRITREGEPVLRSWLSKLFYRVINKVTSMELVQGGSDFRMMRHEVVDAILSLEERERFIKGIFSWVGFNTCWLEYENVERAAGTTKWSMGALMRYAVSGFMGFATAPLRIAVWLGFSIDIVTLVAAIWFIIARLSSDAPRTGYATLVVLVSFFGGTIILLLGIIGEYLAHVYMEVKKRPVFIIRDTDL